MNIPDEGEKVVLLIAENRFITVFKEMTGAFMSSVVVLGVPRQQLRMTEEIPSLPLLKRMWTWLSMSAQA